MATQVLYDDALHRVTDAARGSSPPYTAPSGHQWRTYTQDYQPEVIVGHTYVDTALTHLTNAPSNAATAAYVRDQAHQAYLAWSGQVRHGSWGLLDDIGAAALRATDRWVYHQLALLRIISDDDQPTAWAYTNADRASAARHITDAIRGGYTWYIVMRGSTTLRNSWTAVSTAAGAVVYTDLLGATDGSETGPDGAFIALAVTIPSDFDVESDSLGA